MQFHLAQVTNAKREMSESRQFTNIRFYLVYNRVSQEEEEDLVNGVGWPGWAEAGKNPGKLGDFSAVCFRFAREISKRMGRNKVCILECFFPTQI